MKIILVVILLFSSTISYAKQNYNKAYNYFKSLKDYEYMQYSLQGNITMYSMNGFFDKAKKEREINCV